MEIDPDLLPSRCLIDTGVLIRALGQRDDEGAEACRAFFDAMVSGGRRMLVATPTVAEMLRGNPQPLPRTRSLVYVAFDLASAELLGSEFPIDVLRSYAESTGHRGSYLKYDAMIVACAKRWEAECIVALDGDHRVLAQHVKLEVRDPRNFVRKQKILPFPNKSADSDER